MATKSHEIDPVPTDLLNKSLEGMLHIITKIFNLSLTQGIFVITWETAIVWPLLKKLGLQLIL